MLWKAGTFESLAIAAAKSNVRAMWVLGECGWGPWVCHDDTPWVNDCSDNKYTKNVYGYILFVQHTYIELDTCMDICWPKWKFRLRSSPSGSVSFFEKDSMSNLAVKQRCVGILFGIKLGL